MSERSAPYRMRPPETYEKVKEEAIGSRFFVLQQVGPTGFVLRDEHDNKFRVFVGDRLSCGCGNSGAEHCVHTVYVMIKVLRVPEANPLSWQLSLVDAEVSSVLSMRDEQRKRREQEAKRAERRREMQERAARNRGRQGAQEEGQDDLEDETPQVDTDDMCPICHENFGVEGGVGLTWCRHGCGNVIHAECMKVWADHKTASGDAVTCPFCRNHWSADALVFLRKDVQKARRSLPTHQHTHCKRCKQCPIRGTLYVCLLCEPAFYLCSECFAHEDAPHRKHPFVKRDQPRAPLTPAIRANLLEEMHAQASLVAAQHRAAVTAALERRNASAAPGSQSTSQAQQSPAKDETCAEYFVRMVARHEPSKQHWMEGGKHMPHAAGSMPPGTRSELERLAMGCSYGCGATGISSGRLLRLRCGHVAHLACIDTRARAALDDAPKPVAEPGDATTASVHDQRAVEQPEGVLLRDALAALRCPACLCCHLPGLQAMVRQKPEAKEATRRPDGSLNPSSSRRPRDRDEGGPTMDGMGIVGGGLGNVSPSEVALEGNPNRNRSVRQRSESQRPAHVSVDEPGTAAGDGMGDGCLRQPLRTGRGRRASSVDTAHGAVACAAPASLEPAVLARSKSSVASSQSSGQPQGFGLCGGESGRRKQQLPPRPRRVERTSAGPSQSARGLRASSSPARTQSPARSAPLQRPPSGVGPGRAQSGGGQRPPRPPVAKSKSKPTKRPQRKESPAPASELDLHIVSRGMAQRVADLLS
mmetsp:Transcript_40328/g.96753  ORF Transcript_40328/g.96753 Transcript_40328/m.96753 type:complete len:758 (+) Transcript_40328:35-2308(+)